MWCTPRIYPRSTSLLLYKKDIQYCSSKLQVFLFADDTNAVYAHKDLKTLKLTVNAKFHCLYNWVTSNKLSLNTKKIKLCNVLFIPKKSRRFACSNRSIAFDVKLDSTSCTVLCINTTKFFIDGKYLRQFAYDEMLTLLANSANQRQQQD